MSSSPGDIPGPGVIEETSPAQASGFITASATQEAQSPWYTEVKVDRNPPPRENQSESHVSLGILHYKPAEGELGEYAGNRVLGTLCTAGARNERSLAFFRSLLQERTPPVTREAVHTTGARCLKLFHSSAFHCFNSLFSPFHFQYSPLLFVQVHQSFLLQYLSSINPIQYIFHLTHSTFHLKVQFWSF